MKKLFLLSALSIILFSCEKTEKENPTPQTPPSNNNGNGNQNGNNNGNNNTSVDTIYKIQERVSGFTTANYSFPPSATTIALPSSPNTSANFYDYSGYTMILNGPTGQHLKTGDVIKFYGSTSLQQGYQTSQAWGFDIILFKFIMVDGVETNVGGVNLTIAPYSIYIQNKTHIFTLGQM